MIMEHLTTSGVEQAHRDDRISVTRAHTVTRPTDLCRRTLCPG